MRIRFLLTSLGLVLMSAPVWADSAPSFRTFRSQPRSIKPPAVDQAISASLSIRPTVGETRLLIPRGMLSSLVVSENRWGNGEPRTLFAGVCLSLACASLVVTRGKKWPVKGATIAGLILLAACAMWTGQAEADVRVPGQPYIPRTPEENARRAGLLGPILFPTNPDARPTQPSERKTTLRIEVTDGDSCILLLNRKDAALADSDAGNATQQETSVLDSRRDPRTTKSPSFTPGYSD